MGQQEYPCQGFGCRKGKPELPCKDPGREVCLLRLGLEKTETDKKVIQGITVEPIEILQTNGRISYMEMITSNVKN